LQFHTRGKKKYSSKQILRQHVYRAVHEGKSRIPLETLLTQQTYEQNAAGYNESAVRKVPGFKHISGSFLVQHGSGDDNVHFQSRSTSTFATQLTNQTPPPWSTYSPTLACHPTRWRCGGSPIRITPSTFTAQPSSSTSSSPRSSTRKRIGTRSKSTSGVVGGCKLYLLSYINAKPKPSQLPPHYNEAPNRHGKAQNHYNTLNPPLQCSPPIFILPPLSPDDPVAH
jgi:hypothetical protein